MECVGYLEAIGLYLFQVLFGVGPALGWVWFFEQHQRIGKLYRFIFRKPPDLDNRWSVFAYDFLEYAMPGILFMGGQLFVFFVLYCR